MSRRPMPKTLDESTRLPIWLMHRWKHLPLCQMVDQLNNLERRSRRRRRENFVRVQAPSEAPVTDG